MHENTISYKETYLSARLTRRVLQEDFIPTLKHGHVVEHLAIVKLARGSCTCARNVYLVEATYPLRRTSVLQLFDSEAVLCWIAAVLGAENTILFPFFRNFPP